MIEPRCLSDGEARPPLFQDVFVGAGKWFRRNSCRGDQQHGEGGSAADAVHGFQHFENGTAQPRLSCQFGTMFTAPGGERDSVVLRAFTVALCIDSRFDTR